MPVVSQGDVVTVCIRPEDVVTRNVTAKTPNAVLAIVDELEFLGSFYRATLRPRESDPTRFRADFSINLMRDLGIAEGGEVTVSLPPEHLRIYKDTFISTGDAI
jgi:iron(III) transport system ATP-binding protein